LIANHAVASRAGFELHVPKVLNFDFHGFPFLKMQLRLNGDMSPAASFRILVAVSS
jgi:hypothetical protein